MKTDLLDLISTTNPAVIKAAMKTIENDPAGLVADIGEFVAFIVKTEAAKSKAALVLALADAKAAEKMQAALAKAKATPQQRTRAIKILSTLLIDDTSTDDEGGPQVIKATVVCSIRLGTDEIATVAIRRYENGTTTWPQGLSFEEMDFAFLAGEAGWDAEHRKIASYYGLTDDTGDYDFGELVKLLDPVTGEALQVFQDLLAAYASASPPPLLYLVRN